jgi:hypothetical protein
MKRNYELNECYECLRKNFAAKAADLYEFGQLINSYHLQRSCKILLASSNAKHFVKNSYYSCNS